MFLWRGVDDSLICILHLDYIYKVSKTSFKMIIFWYLLRLLWYILQSSFIIWMELCPARWDKVLLKWAHTKICMCFTACIHIPENHEWTYMCCICSVREQRTSANICNCCGKTTYQCVLRCFCVLTVSVASRNLSLQRLPTYFPQPICFWSSGWWPWWTRGEYLCDKNSDATFQCRNKYYHWHYIGYVL